MTSPVARHRLSVGGVRPWHRGAVLVDRVRRRRRLVAVAAIPPLVLAGLVVGVQELSVEGRQVPALVLTGVAWAVFAGGVFLVHRLPERPALRLAVWGGAALQVVAARVVPFTTNDHLRYVWDARVQASGTSPYRYPPGAGELAGLRDSWLFPDGVTPALNHPDDRTIYPPVAQAWFWFVHVLPGGDGRGRALQLAAAVLAVITSVAVVRLLRRTGGDPRRVVWWAWCPTVVLEAGGNAHVDALAALLVVLVMSAVAGRRWSWAGVLLGLAVAVKFLPALVAVAVAPRRSLRVGLVVVATVAAGYVPHVAVLGLDVTGFLGGYLAEESRDRFAVPRFVLVDGLGRPELVAPAGFAVLGAAVLTAWWWAGREHRQAESAGRPARPWLAAAPVVGITFAMVAPSYPWYGLLLVPLVALGARAVWLFVPAATYLVYAAVPLGLAYGGTRVIGYGAALVVVGLSYAVIAIRRRRSAGANPDRPGADRDDRTAADRGARQVAAGDDRTAAAGDDRDPTGSAQPGGSVAAPS
ncbi:MAG: glycosyltransferase 87 family protein [Angustibacter sp.]